MKTKHYCRWWILGIVLISQLIFNSQCVRLQRTSSEVFKYRLLRLHYKNSNGEKALTTFDYDEKNHLRLAVWERVDSRRYSINYYTCNENGDVIRKYREFSDSITTTQTFEYDPHNNLLSETFERSDGIHGNSTYTYDDNGIIMKANCNGLNGWFYGIIEYTTDDSGVKKSADIIQNGRASGSITYTYDNRGNLVQEVWKFGNGWTQTFDYEYERCDYPGQEWYSCSNVFFNASRPFRVEKEEYDYSDQMDGPSYYQYAADGKLLRKRFERSDGFSTVTEYLYDYQRRLTKSYRRYSNGLSAVFTFSFNDSGKMLRCVFQRIDGISGSETCVYDQADNLVSVRYENSDGWLTGILSFVPNDDETIRDATFQGEGGLTAKVTFTYDENENPVTIHWVFSDGKTQTYNFEYNP
ncbi:hypothetical protein JW960_00830 [candidate division KSB1 bacterium]|nr:hypothetical protein [candidate division KSB1 bacterium]